MGTPLDLILTFTVLYKAQAAGLLIELGLYRYPDQPLLNRCQDAIGTDHEPG